MFTNKSFLNKSQQESLNSNTIDQLMGGFQHLHFILFFNERTKEKISSYPLQFVYALVIGFLEEGREGTTASCGDLIN